MSVAEHRLGGSSPERQWQRYWALTSRYRGLPDWTSVSSPHVERTCDIPGDWTMASLSRPASSHRGIGDRRQLKTLFVSEADQLLLDEICELDGLEYLWLFPPIAAQDLVRMGKLKGRDALAASSLLPGCICLNIAGTLSCHTRPVLHSRSVDQRRARWSSGPAADGGEVSGCAARMPSPRSAFPYPGRSSSDRANARRARSVFPLSA